MINVRKFVRNRKNDRKMATVNLYRDKSDKKGYAPIHLVIRCDGKKIKVATGEKVKSEDWDSDEQHVRNNEQLNTYFSYLKKETETFLSKGQKKDFTINQVKEQVASIVDCYKSSNETKIVADETPYYGQKISFVDLFAGAGGFSEGFLQAEQKNKIFDFLLASDINENCELTHLVRYNKQLGLATKFIKQDISEPDFIANLKLKLGNQNVDVVCGGPPCQSFSLAGKRKKFDKKDDLFSHYLEVISHLRPKYFVMENVKGILTKESGKIKEMILSQIRSIIDYNELPKLFLFLNRIKKIDNRYSFVVDCYIQRLQFETIKSDELNTIKEKYISNVEQKFRNILPKIADYKTSKTDSSINSIRHGFNLLKRIKDLRIIKKQIIIEKSVCDLDNDNFVEKFNDFLSFIEPDSIVDVVSDAFSNLNSPKEYAKEINDISTSLTIFTQTIDECLKSIRQIASFYDKNDELEEILQGIHLYNIDEPFVALASDYGVPQNRERVLFIGCRKDQPLIKNIPATVKEKEKVTVFEALYDLDFIGNDEESHAYSTSNSLNKYNGSSEYFRSLIKKRSVDGKESESGKTYSEWSRIGRLNGRFANMKPPLYVRNADELKNPLQQFHFPLNNHKTSNQNEEVIKRLEIILNTGDYDKAKALLKKEGLDSDKRNYNILKPDTQSPTIMTIPDDYIHFSTPRALTVREMARLQSFDDSFVFQGKRSTGGNKRKDEVPQFTLVGNAVPPLLARAIGLEILKNIK